MNDENCGVCPRCSASVQIACEDAKRRLITAYGKVSEEEYARLISVAARDRNTLSVALRECCEVYMSEAGVLSVYYGCTCEVCGFKHEFNHKEDINASEKPQSQTE